MVLSLLCFNGYASYEAGKSFGTTNISSMKKFFSQDVLSSVPHYKGTDTGAPETATEISRKSSDALQESEVGKTIISSMSRDSKFEFSDEDPLLQSAEKIGKDPLSVVAKHLGGKVKPVVTKKITREICEHSGEPSYISCKYILKTLPIYGEHGCEEQHDKSIEKCTKELSVTPVLENKLCEQGGHAITKKVVSKLVPKNSPRGGVPVYTPYLRPKYAFTLLPSSEQVKSLPDGKVRMVRKEIYGKISRELNKRVAGKIKSGSALWWGYFRTYVGDNPSGMGGFGMPFEIKTSDYWIENLGFHWVNDKPSISGAICTKKSERCIEGSSAKTWYGNKFNRSCWKKEITYECSFPSCNNCLALREQGCSQSSSKCLKRFDGVCVNYENTMQCFKDFSEKWTGCEEYSSNSSCSLVNETCTKGRDTKIIYGRDVTRDCWGKTYSYACSYPSLNNCEKLRLSKSCKEIKHECKKKVGDYCVVMNRTYKCVDGVNEDGHVSNCHDLERKELKGICERVNHVPEVKQTKSVEGYEHDAIWERTNVFKCQHPSKNNCDGYLAMGCKVESSKCKKMQSETCVVWEKQLICSEEEQTEDTIHGSKIPCLDGSCKGDDDINDSNIGESIAKLSALNELAGDNVQTDSSDNISYFGGDGRKCKKWMLKSLNCCKLDGWIDGIIPGCGFEDKQLAHFRNEKYCHDVGSYCSVKEPTGGCLVKKNSYCCFKGILQRVVQQSGRAQLGISWGTPKDPDCRGLTAAEFSKINFDLIDFSEVEPSVLAKFKGQIASKVQENATLMVKREISRGTYDTRG